MKKLIVLMLVSFFAVTSLIFAKGHTTIRMTASYKTGWNPSQITVKEGERVTLRISSLDSHHFIVIPSIGVRGPNVQAGRTRSVTFKASKAGTYPFHCGVHPKMIGELIVTGKGAKSGMMPPAPPSSQPAPSAPGY